MVNLLFVTPDTPLLEPAEKLLAKQHITLIPGSSLQQVSTCLKKEFVWLMAVDFRLPRTVYQPLMTELATHYPELPVLGLTPMDPQALGLGGNALAACIPLPYTAQAFKREVLDLIHMVKQGGSVPSVSPPLFSQLMEMEQRSAILRIFEKGSQNGGILVFDQGRLVDARFRQFSALDAACRILAWEEADVFLQDLTRPCTDRIQMDLQSVIMTSVHQKDEGQKAPLPQTPAPKSPLPDQLESFIREKMTTRCPVEKAYSAPTLSPFVQKAGELGALFDYGRLKQGYARNQEGSIAFVPAEQPIGLILKEPCPKDTLTHIISTYLDGL